MAAAPLDEFEDQRLVLLGHEVILCGPVSGSSRLAMAGRGMSTTPTKCELILDRTLTPAVALHRLLGPCPSPASRREPPCVAARQRSPYGVLEPMTGLEPVTSSLPRTRSTY